MADWEHEVIARRELTRQGSAVVVSVGKPYQEGQWAWFCPFMIEGLPTGIYTHAAGGADAVHALTLGLKMIGDVLQSENGDGSITWDGEPDLGFPHH